MNKFQDDWLAKTLAAIPSYESREDCRGPGCIYCEQNWYDQSDCPKCGNDGCDYCEGHGFVGHSW